MRHVAGTRWMRLTRTCELAVGEVSVFAKAKTSHWPSRFLVLVSTTAPRYGWWTIFGLLLLCVCRVNARLAPSVARG